MPKCNVCNNFYPPQYVYNIDGEKDAKKCIFCKIGKDYVTLLKDDGREVKYTKKECIKDYGMFLKKLKETPGIAEKIAKQEIKIE